MLIICLIQLLRGYSIQSLRGYSIQSLRGYSIQSLRGYSIQSLRGYSRSNPEFFPGLRLEYPRNDKFKVKHLGCNIKIMPKKWGANSFGFIKRSKYVNNA